MSRAVVPHRVTLLTCLVPGVPDDFSDDEDGEADVDEPTVTLGSPTRIRRVPSKLKKGSVTATYETLVTSAGSPCAPFLTCPRSQRLDAFFRSLAYYSSASHSRRNLRIGFSRRWNSQPSCIALPHRSSLHEPPLALRLSFNLQQHL